MFCVTDDSGTPPPLPSWTFLGNHAHVLVCITRQPDIRLREIADLVGIGERAAHRIVHELIDAGFVTRIRDGRRNVYTVDLDRPLRHPLESDHLIRSIVEPLVDTPPPTGGDE